MNNLLTEVGDTNATGKVEHLSPICDGKVGAFAFLHNRIERPAQSSRDIFLAKLNSGC